LQHVIPGRAEGANPESRKTKNADVSGFRARRFAAPRNDREEFFRLLGADLSPFVPADAGTQFLQQSLGPRIRGGERNLSY
jgi:hypothetical protein